MRVLCNVFVFYAQIPLQAQAYFINEWDCMMGRRGGGGVGRLRTCVFASLHNSVFFCLFVRAYARVCSSHMFVCWRQWGFLFVGLRSVGPWLPTTVKGQDWYFSKKTKTHCARRLRKKAHTLKPNID